MIKNVPPPQEFYESGISLLNFAWGTVTSLLLEADESEDYGVEISEVEGAFWAAAKQQLTTSLAIAQQGVEFILKGRISEISPFLLIANLPKEFPKNSAQVDINFSDFRTIDAQDLVKLHDTFAPVRLPKGFQEKFEELRQKRNIIMHTVKKDLTIQATDVIADILSVHKHLFPKQNFVTCRRAALDVSPSSELHSNDHVDFHVIREFSLVVELLSPSQTKEFFDFNKKQRRYICPKCAYECRENGDLPRTALLTPNTPASDMLFCFICEEKHMLTRESCPDTTCKGNAISLEFDICTSCGQDSARNS